MASKGREHEVEFPFSKRGMRDERRASVFITGATANQWATLEACLFIYGFDHAHLSPTVMGSAAREVAKTGATVLHVVIEPGEYRFGVWEVDPATRATVLRPVATPGKRADVDAPAMNRSWRVSAS